MDPKVREIMRSPEGQQMNRDLLAGRELSPEGRKAMAQLRQLRADRQHQKAKPVK